MGNKNLKEKIIENYENFSKREYKVANYIIENYENILYMSSGELAKVVGVSDSTVVRFAKQLGYKGFLQFRSDMKSEFRAIHKPYMALGEMRELDISTSSKYFENIVNDINEFALKTDISKIESVAEKILKAKTVYLVGIGSDSIMAKYMAEYLTLIGIKCVQIVEEGLHLKQSMLLANKNDYIFMSSFPSVQDDEYWITSYAKENKIDISVITDSELTAKSLGVEEYFCAKISIESFYNSSILVMLLCDMILTKISELAGEKVKKALKRYDEAVEE